MPLGEWPAIFDEAVVDYYPADNVDIAMDSKITPDGWTFELWILF